MYGSTLGPKKNTLMNDSVSSPWPVQQQAWLRALGHTVWLYGSALTALPLPKSSAQTRPTSHQLPSIADTKPPVAKAKPIQPAEDVAQASTLVTSVPDPLFLALLRASGSRPNQPHIHHLIASSGSLDELRTSPAAKRALWPQLRALRRQQRQSHS